MKPNTLVALSNALNSLPTVTKKNAEKIAYFLVNNKELGEILITNINDVNKKIRHCETCHHLCEDKICSICSDKTRKKTLVIVETTLDVFKFEEKTDFKPYYHVLGSLINISKKIEFKDLFLTNLRERAKDMNEIIIALSPNLEGIVTANYLSELLQDYKVTQLAQGIPLGAAMEYVDELTLKIALENRKKVK